MGLSTVDDVLLYLPFPTCRLMKPLLLVESLPPPVPQPLRVIAAAFALACGEMLPPETTITSAVSVSRRALIAAPISAFSLQ